MASKKGGETGPRRERVKREGEGRGSQSNSKGEGRGKKERAGNLISLGDLSAVEGRQPGSEKKNQKMKRRSWRRRSLWEATS